MASDARAAWRTLHAEDHSVVCPLRQRRLPARVQRERLEQAQRLRLGLEAAPLCPAPSGRSAARKSPTARPPLAAARTGASMRPRIDRAWTVIARASREVPVPPKLPPRKSEGAHPPLPKSKRASSDEDSTRPAPAEVVNEAELA